eukprot:763419-Hanusia_phi.AAC.1
MRREGTHSPSKKPEGLLLANLSSCESNPEAAHVEMDYVMLGSQIVPLSEFQSMDDMMASMVAGELALEEDERKRRGRGTFVQREITF